MPARKICFPQLVTPKQFAEETGLPASLVRSIFDRVPRTTMGGVVGVLRNDLLEVCPPDSAFPEPEPEVAAPVEPRKRARRTPPEEYIAAAGFNGGTIYDDQALHREYVHLRDEHCPGWTWAGRVNASGRPCEWCNADYNLVVDHCHGCGRVRGILCVACNLTEGHGASIPGWSERCGERTAFYRGRGWSDAYLSPMRCGGTDAFSIALRQWWRDSHPNAAWSEQP